MEGNHGWNATDYIIFYTEGVFGNECL